MLARLVDTAIRAWNIAAHHLPPRSLYRTGVREAIKELRHVRDSYSDGNAAALDIAVERAIKVAEVCHLARLYDAQGRRRNVDAPDLDAALDDLDRMVRVATAAHRVHADA